MPCHVLRPSRPHPMVGFTLIELLVVISIIALLVGILLPVLGSARESARQAVCMAHQRGLMQAVINYAVNDDGWFPGPHTSGHAWSFSPNLDGNSYGLDSMDPGESGPSSRPVQNMDWMSPSLWQSMGLPSDDFDKVRVLYGNEIRCPSNEYMYTSAWPSGSPTPPELTTIPFASYASALGMHANPSYEARVGSAAPITLKVQGGLNQITLPADYEPRMELLGSPESKVFIFEGSRHVNGAPGSYDVSFNLARHQEEGGGFMAIGPYTRVDNSGHNLPEQSTGGFVDDWTGGLSRLNRDMAYRHSDGMNRAFFDGHAAFDGVNEVVDSSDYFPKGTILNLPNATYDRDDQAGDRF